jgi:hypothetical protein
MDLEGFRSWVSGVGFRVTETNYPILSGFLEELRSQACGLKWGNSVSDPTPNTQHPPPKTLSDLVHAAAGRRLWLIFSRQPFRILARAVAFDLKLRPAHVGEFDLDSVAGIHRL